LNPYFVKYGHSTGGPLNPISELDGRQKSLTSKANSISLNELKKRHPEIKYNEQMWAEVDRHYHENCECGLKSKKTLEMIAQSIYDEQDRPEAKVILEKKGDSKWDFETVLEWVKLLYGRNTLKGQGMEKYGVDIVVKNKNQQIAGGIQVKPLSYYRTGIDHVKQMNDAWEHPVYHLKYDDLENKNWLNRLEIISKFI
jgi:hypothetical protein